MASSVNGLGPDPEGATPLSEEELEGLIPDHVTTRAELNQEEFENILGALPWARSQAERSEPGELLTYGFVFALHRRMFSDVWSWAGTQRWHETNLGVGPMLIVEMVKSIVDDARYWHEHGTFPVEEIAVRLHHRLVSVHPFVNGNGRCTRLAADLYLVACGGNELAWGGDRRLGDVGEVRRAYLEALRAADHGDYGPLLAFSKRI